MTIRLGRSQKPSLTGMSQAPKSLTVAGLAQAGAVGIETVRYYQTGNYFQSRPVLAEVPSAAMGYPDVQRRRFIRAAQAAGFTPEEFAKLLAPDATRDRKRAREIAKDRIAALDVQIAEMAAARNSLKRLAKECGSGTKGPCPIIMAFES